jgi:hypothetical protein
MFVCTPRLMDGISADWALSEFQDRLPQLNAAQMIKLKHLSIVSLAAERRVSIHNIPQSDWLMVQ